MDATDASAPASAATATASASQTDARVVAAVFHGWLGLRRFGDAKNMLAECLGIDVAPERAGVVVSIESMVGLHLGTFRLPQEEATRLVGILGTNGLPEFGRTIREHVRVALTRPTRPNADNVWPELLSLPLHLFKHGEGDDVDVLQEYDPKGDSASWSKWLQGKTPLLRVAPFVDSTKLMRTFYFALFCLVASLNDSWLHSHLYGLHGWFYGFMCFSCICVQNWQARSVARTSNQNSRF